MCVAMVLSMFVLIVQCCGPSRFDLCCVLQCCGASGFVCFVRGCVAANLTIVLCLAMLWPRVCVVCLCGHAVVNLGVILCVCVVMFWHIWISVFD